MKKIIIIVLCIIAVIAIGTPLFRMYTKMASPETSAQISAKDLKVSIFYSQPSKKERDIFGTLVPYGKVWRTGANEATEIELSRDVTIGGKSLKAGRYSLFTIPEKEKWTIIFNSDLDMWGLSHDEAKDVLRVEVPATEGSEVVEKFTISFKEAETGADMTLAWDKTQVTVPIR